MTDNRPGHGYEGQVRCEVCGKQIPASEAYQPEGGDYTLYFCGLDCYHAWRRQHAGDDSESSG